MPFTPSPNVSPRPPVLELITQDVVDTLSEIVAANGASIDLIVERPSPATGNRIRDGLALVVQGPNPTKVVDGVPVQYTQWDQPYEVYLHSLQSSQDTTPVDARLNRMLADVMREIVRDRTRGGLAIWTEINDPEFDTLNVTANGGRVIATFTVTYRTMRDDPFTSPHNPTP